MQASPDGYALLWITQTNAINATLYKNLKFNFMRDIQAVAGVIRVPTVMLVNPGVPASHPGVHRLRQANPGKINMSSAAIGSANHVLGELFQMVQAPNSFTYPIKAASFPI